MSYERDPRTDEEFARDVAQCELRPWVDKYLHARNNKPRPGERCDPDPDLDGPDEFDIDPNEGDR